MDLARVFYGLTGPLRSHFRLRPFGFLTLLGFPSPTGFGGFGFLVLTFRFAVWGRRCLSFFLFLRVMLVSMSSFGVIPAVSSASLCDRVSLSVFPFLVNGIGVSPSTDASVSRAPSSSTVNSPRPIPFRGGDGSSRPRGRSSCDCGSLFGKSRLLMTSGMGVSNNSTSGFSPVSPMFSGLVPPCPTRVSIG